MLQKNKTKEDFSLETWPLLIGLKSLRKMLKKRLVVGLINFKYFFRDFNVHDSLKYLQMSHEC